MPRSSGRGQFEPLVALAAVLAVSAGITLYTGTLDDAVPPDRGRETAETVRDRVRGTLVSTGVASPGRLDAAMGAIPNGWRANVTLTAGGQRWHRGPVPSGSSERATTRVSVRLGPKRIVPGQLRVIVWQ